jgi:glutamate dehydrogenase (NAD(P)+)
MLHVYDPAVGLQGLVVIDNTVVGGLSGGGIRMLPDITTHEIKDLARAMTFKFCAADFPLGGAKSGIWAQPDIEGEKRVELMKAFGRAIKPLLQSGLIVGADIGTCAEDLALIHDGAEIPFNYSGLSIQEKEGEPLENHATGYGAVVAARAAGELCGLDLNGATVALEGFGKAGGGAARYLVEAGAKVVAISTIEGAIYNPDGLDIMGLLAARRTLADKAVTAYENAEHLKPEQLYTLPVQVLMPGARPHVIDHQTAADIKARVISSIANNPITAEGEAVLFQREVMVVPDFISNAGGITIAAIDLLNGTEDMVFKVIDALIADNTKQILSDARRKGIVPRQLAELRAREKINNATKAASPVSIEQALEAMQVRFNL